MYVIFCMILYDHLLFLKNSFMHVTFFLSNLDFVQPLGVFATICPLNDSLAFSMLI